MKFRKLTALLLSASMAVGLLAGCGGTPSTTETGTPSTGDPDLEDEISGFEWNQNVRIVLAILVVFISALVVWWIVS